MIIQGMCSSWLTKYASSNIIKMELVYPMTDHSFLPSDRVFGLIEKELREKTTIITVKEYHEVFEKYGTVKVVGQDWTRLNSIHNWKDESEEFIKPPNQFHFKI